MDVNATFREEYKLWNNLYRGKKWVLENRLENNTEGITVTNSRRDIGFSNLPIEKIVNTTGFSFCSGSDEDKFGGISWIPIYNRFSVTSSSLGRTFCIFDP
ncbi:Oidioi.mRNA.OKI2018_I69.PAR.g9950.t1.cds [Oikopleura dioica]|uniref:Oidioi.mRNA.OKI2018_I69.PAR.g9950.t1.cds n=1 Tax=Oikopleura dioica TaxID=34765 RepID=A0ABN7RN33_OIKDI|nr:Oidioi.mRNA.OKI2018_I69.PAR.g9950.t1.cds [Oikopleura dioica]